MTDVTTEPKQRTIRLDMLMYRERVPHEELERRLYGIEYTGSDPIEVGEVLLVPDVAFRQENLAKGYKKHVYETSEKRMVVDQIKVHHTTTYGTMYTMLVCTRRDEEGNPNK